MVTLFKKWIIGIINHPINIIKGNWFRFRNKENKLYLERYSKCNLCGDKEMTPIGEVCGRCGCPLKSKLRVKEEKCELDRWK